MMLTKKHIFWGIAIIYLAAISIASSLNAIPAGLHRINDKILHFFEFFILAFLLLLALVNSEAKRPYASAIAIGIIFAVSDELHQLFVAGRTASIYDFIADIAGISAILIAKLKFK